MIAVYFISIDQKYNLPVPCLSSDIFSKIEEKLYIEYSELKGKNIYFIAKGNLVNKSTSLEENKIKNGVQIIINYE